MALKGFDSFRGGLDNKSEYEKFLHEFDILVFIFSYHQILKFFLFTKSVVVEKYFVAHV